MFALERALREAIRSGRLAPPRRGAELIGVTPRGYGGPVSTMARDLDAAGDVLDAARRGGGAAFETLIAPHRRTQHVHCCRMLGSYVDAEDHHHNLPTDTPRWPPADDARRTPVKRILTTARHSRHLAGLYT